MMLTKNFTNLSLMVGIGLRSKLLFILVIYSILSCSSTIQQGIEIAESASEDQEYFDVYQRSTNQYEVIENFKTKFKIHATQLNGDIRQAISSRHQKLYGETSPILTEATNQTGFFISLYVAETGWEDLRDSRIWSIILQDGEQSLRPIVVKRLSKKDQWQAYFPSIDIWTQEFLVLFDLPSPGSGNQKLVQRNKSRLTVANHEAKVHMEW